MKDGAANLRSFELAASIFMGGMSIKSKQLSYSRNASKTTQSKILRTKSVRKRPAGCLPKKGL